MMRRPARWRLLISAIAFAAIAGGTWWALWQRLPDVRDAAPVARPPRIRPDYSGIVLPPNIAPLNFAIREQGERFFVRMQGEAGGAIGILSRSPAIVIPPRRWRALLGCNAGKKVRWDVFVENNGRWRRYDTIENRIAREAIDPYLVYRLIPPVHNTWDRVGIYQRNLATGDESPVLDGKPLGTACVNCHSFPANNPQRMLVGIRSDSFGRATLVSDGRRVTKLGSTFGYTAWHPSGRIAVYSTNKVRQFFHTASPEVRDVIDLQSALAYFRVDAGDSKQVPGASSEAQLATYPAWSPDGRWLYYCRAPRLWTDSDTVPPERYSEVKYDLVRIAYDIEHDRWGTPETVLKAEETGLSILLPRLSPDGKYLLFCMCRYGCFPIYQPTSDLYLMDLRTGTYERLAINSESSESWHSWSSNSRWIAFSSKRGGGVFTRCYLSYIDESGKAHKPLMLPQADPEFYESFLNTVSVPELLTGPVPVSAAALRRAALSEHATRVDVRSPGPSMIDTTEPYRQADQ